VVGNVRVPTSFTLPHQLLLRCSSSDPNPWVFGLQTCMGTHSTVTHTCLKPKHPWVIVECVPIIKSSSEFNKGCLRTFWANFFRISCWCQGGCCPFWRSLPFIGLSQFGWYWTSWRSIFFWNTFYRTTSFCFFIVAHGFVSIVITSNFIVSLGLVPCTL